MSSLTIHYPASGGKATIYTNRIRGRFTLPVFAFALYLTGCLAGFMLRLPGPAHSGQLAVIWPPNAVLVFFLLLLPAARWPTVLLSALPAHLLAQGLVGTPAWLMAVQFGHNAIFAILVAGSVRHLSGQTRFAFDTLWHTIIFVVAGAGLMSAIAAVFPATARVVAGLSSDFASTWRSVALSNALSLCILTPLFVEFYFDFLRNPPPRPRWLRFIEFIVLFSGLAIAGFLIFDSFPGGYSGRIPALVYLPLPLLLWAALRFGPVGVSLSLLVVAAICIRCTLAGYGPFANGSPSENVATLQCFLLALCLPMLCLAVLAREGASATTTARRNEAIAREQYALLANIYRNAPIGLAFVDTKQVFHEINEYLARNHGLPVEAHIGRSVYEILSPEVAAAGSAICKRVIETGEEDVDCEISGPSAAYQNQQRNWLVSHYPVKNDGVVIGVNVILQDITERKKAEAEIRKNQIALQASVDRIRDLAGRLIEVQEVERTRIARELHDDVTQRVAVLSISLSNMRRKLPASAFELQEAVTQLQDEARQLAEELRNLSHELHPGILRQLGLIPALSIYRQEFQHSTGIETELDVAGVSSQIPPISTELALCVYRVAQEALRNVARHSCAKKVCIAVSHEAGNLVLCIKDDGCGFNVEKGRIAGGLGLLSIDERIRLVRGSVTIESRPQFGTRLFIQVPLKGNDHVPTETAIGG